MILPQKYNTTQLKYKRHFTSRKTTLKSFNFYTPCFIHLPWRNSMQLSITKEKLHVAYITGKPFINMKCPRNFKIIRQKHFSNMKCESWVSFLYRHNLVMTMYLSFMQVRENTDEWSFGNTYICLVLIMLTFLIRQIIDLFCSLRQHHILHFIVIDCPKVGGQNWMRCMLQYAQM